MSSALMNKAGSRLGARTGAQKSRRAVVVRAGDPFLAVSTGTLAMLAVGRFAFLPYQRREVSKALNVSGPKTTGERREERRRMAFLAVSGALLFELAPAPGNYDHIGVVELLRRRRWRWDA